VVIRGLSTQRIQAGPVAHGGREKVLRIAVGPAAGESWWCPAWQVAAACWLATAAAQPVCITPWRPRPGRPCPCCFPPAAAWIQPLIRLIHHQPPPDVAGVLSDLQTPPGC